MNNTYLILKMLSASRHAFGNPRDKTNCEGFVDNELGNFYYLSSSVGDDAGMTWVCVWGASHVGEPEKKSGTNHRIATVASPNYYVDILTSVHPLTSSLGAQLFERLVQLNIPSNSITAIALALSCSYQ